MKRLLNIFVIIYNLLYAITLLGSTVYVEIFKLLNLLLNNEKATDIVLLGGIYIVNSIYIYINRKNKSVRYYCSLVIILINTLVYSYVLLMILLFS